MFINEEQCKKKSEQCEALSAEARKKGQLKAAEQYEEAAKVWRYRSLHGGFCDDMVSA